MRSSRNITMSRGESVSQGVDKLLAVREEKTRAELHRVRNTFSFRLGLLLTESFIRKPWLFPLIVGRLVCNQSKKNTRFLYEKFGKI